MATVLEFEEDMTTLNVQTSGVKTTVVFGTRYAFATIDPGIDKTLLEGSDMFNMLRAGEPINFNAHCIVYIPKKDHPNLTVHNLRHTFDFGYVQGLRQSTIVVEYWGEFANHGRSFLATAMPGTWEVDTEDGIKPFTRLESERCKVSAAPHQKPGFHAFRIRANFGDNPLWRSAHTADVPPDKSFKLPVKRYIRSFFMNRTFVTIFCAREKSNGEFTAISAADWSINHNHKITHSVAKDGTLTRTVIGPDNIFPKAGSASVIGAVHRQVLAMAKGGGPFTTPIKLAERARAVTLDTEAKNPDFFEAFFSRET